MVIKFDLKVEPFSVNRMYYRDKRHKTAEYRDWEKTVFSAMSAPDVQQKLKAAREYFDESKHFLSVKFVFCFPDSVLFNAKGLISSRAEDLSNTEKPLLDLICLPKYHVQAFPYGVPNLNLDDKQVLKLTSLKVAFSSYKTQVVVHIKAKPSRVVGP